MSILARAGIKTPARANHFSSGHSDVRLEVNAPTDDELYFFLKKSTLRFFPLVLAICYMPILYSIVKFCQKSPFLWLLYPHIALLVVSLIVSSHSSNRKHRFSLAKHLAVLKSYNPTRFPSVDVFLPSCGEKISILRNTFDGVSKLVWAGELNVYVMDDADSEQVKALAQEFGFHYQVRADMGYMKKAGNLKSAFDKTSGDLILILDADFVIRPDGLQHLVPYFEDQTIGIVQSPQFFDVSRNQNWLQRGAGATQDLFYRWIQPSRDALDSAICVGTNAIYRREALDQVGGFYQIEHSEDVHTGFALAECGYRLRYVPVIVSKGLCPDELKGFISQQYRWAAGSLALLRNSAIHSSENTNSVKRRLPYFSGFLYDITTAFNVWLAPVPAVIMMFVYPADVRSANYLPLLGVCLSQLVLLPLISRGRYTPGVLRVQTLYSIAHGKALLDTFRNQLSGWVATGAGNKGTSATSVVLFSALAHATGFGLLLILGCLNVFTKFGLAHSAAAFCFATFWVYLYSPVVVDLLKTLQKQSVEKRVPSNG